MIQKSLLALTLTLTAAAVTVAAGVADSGKEKIRFNAADQAGARATVLRRADLGSAQGWIGGRKKPDLTSSPTCPNYHPKQSDLVLTGAAESEFRRGPVVIHSAAQVLETTHMVRLDWQREVQAPGALPCLRQSLAKGIGGQGKVISFDRVSFPRLVPMTAAFRANLGVNMNGTSVPVRVEVILLGVGRTELTLTVTTAFFFPPSLSTQTVRLARLLVSRARA